MKNNELYKAQKLHFYNVGPVQRERQPTWSTSTTQDSPQGLQGIIPVLAEPRGIPEHQQV